MGDIISSVVGSSQNTQQDVSVDPTTQALNDLKRQQAAQLFATSPLSTFAAPSDAYAPNPAVAGLLGRQPDLSNTLGLGDYINNFSNASTDSFNFGRGIGQQDFGIGLNNINQQYNDTLGLTQGNTNRALAASDARFNTMYGTGLDQARNYIHEIATPEIMQSNVLSGTEQGGAVPAAIAKATAQVGLPFVQNLIAQYMQEQSGLQQQNIAAQAQAAGQRMGLTGQQLQQYVQGQMALSGQNLQAQQSFYAGLPNAASTLTMTPVQAQLGTAQAGATLFPLADYGSSLAREDLARRQGVAGTAFTGLPYTPETSTTQAQRSPSIGENIMGGLGFTTGVMGFPTGLR